MRPLILLIFLGLAACEPAVLATYRVSVDVPDSVGTLTLDLAAGVGAADEPLLCGTVYDVAAIREEVDPDDEERFSTVETTVYLYGTEDEKASGDETVAEFSMQFDDAEPETCSYSEGAPATVAFVHGEFGTLFCRHDPYHDGE